MSSASTAKMRPLCQFCADGALHYFQCEQRQLKDVPVLLALYSRQMMADQDIERLFHQDMQLTHHLMFPVLKIGFLRKDPGTDMLPEHIIKASKKLTFPAYLAVLGGRIIGYVHGKQAHEPSSREKLLKRLHNEAYPQSRKLVITEMDIDCSPERAQPQLVQSDVCINNSSMPMTTDISVTFSQGYTMTVTDSSNWNYANSSSCTTSLEMSHSVSDSWSRRFGVTVEGGVKLGIWEAKAQAQYETTHGTNTTAGSRNGNNNTQGSNSTFGGSGSKAQAKTEQMAVTIERTVNVAPQKKVCLKVVVNHSTLDVPYKGIAYMQDELGNEFQEHVSGHISGAVFVPSEVTVSEEAVGFRLPPSMAKVPYTAREVAQYANLPDEAATSLEALRWSDLKLMKRGIISNVSGQEAELIQDLRQANWCKGLITTLRIAIEEIPLPDMTEPVIQQTKTEKGKKADKSKAADKGKQANKTGEADKGKKANKGDKDKGKAADKNKEASKGKEGDKGKGAGKGEQTNKADKNGKA